MPRLSRLCAVQDLPPQYVSEILGLMLPGEQALFCCESWNKAGAATRILTEVLLQSRDARDYHLACVITSKQLIMVGNDYWPAAFGRRFRLADIVHISDIEQGLTGFVVEVTGPDRRRIAARFANKEHALDYVRWLVRAIALVKAPS